MGVVLAAGRGNRMKSEKIKVLHPICGISMLGHTVNALKESGVRDCIVVAGYQHRAVMDELRNEVRYVIQREQLGTGHALMQVQGHVDDTADMLVLCGDTPLLKPETLKRLVDSHQGSRAAATVLTAVLDDPFGYGRVIRNDRGEIVRIVEEADATPAEAAVKEINTGIYCFQAAKVFRALSSVRTTNAQKEYYLVDVIPVLLSQGERVHSLRTDDPDEVMGVNTRKDLSRAERLMRRRIVERLWGQGVSIPDPDTVYIDPRARVEMDSTILPFTVIEGYCEIGKGCRVGPGAHIISSKLGERVSILYSVVEESRIGNDVSIGPFSHLRANTILEERVSVGNFAEIKNSRVGSGTKIPHHSYLGDAIVGQGVNIGAGAITVNYDGINKNATVIGDHAFIGCNSNLIAPVRIEEGSYVAAGSTINKDVPAGALAIARSRQENKPGWAERIARKEKNEKQ